jgi:hypothetical protein
MLCASLDPTQRTKKKKISKKQKMKEKKKSMQARKKFSSKLSEFCF